MNKKIIKLLLKAMMDLDDERYLSVEEKIALAIQLLSSTTIQFDDPEYQDYFIYSKNITHE